MKTEAIPPLDEVSRVLHDKALSRARRYLAAEGELLEVILEVDRELLYEKFDCPFLTPYCVLHLGLTEDVAAMFVRVARKSVKVPALMEAIKAGELSISKAKTIASVIDESNYAEWIEKAKYLSKRKLEREVAHDLPVGSKPEFARVKAETVRVEFEITHEQMEQFRRAQDLVSQGKQKFASLADTVGVMLNCFLQHNDPVLKAERAAKRRAKADTKPSKAQDSAIKKPAPGKADREDRSRGRSTNDLATPLVHELNLRDRGRCQWRMPNGEICGCTRWIHFHHIVPKSEGGADTLENLITLCSAHHRILHRRRAADKPSA